MKLGAKLRISYVGIVLAAVSIVLILVVEDAQKGLQEKIGHDLQTVAAIEAGHINQYVKSKMKEVGRFAKDYLFVSGGIKDMQEYVEAVNREDRTLNDILVLSPEGKTLAASYTPAYSDDTITEIEVPKQLREKAMNLEKDGLLLQYGYRDENRKMIQAVAIAPIRKKYEGKPRALLVVTISLDPFMTEAGILGPETVAGKNAYLIKSASTMIITQDGVVQSFSPLIFLQADSRLRDRKRVEREGYTAYEERGGEKVLAGYADLDQYGVRKVPVWSVISRAPQKEVFSPAIRLRNRMIILGIVVVGAAWVLSFIIAQGITRPIRKLVRVTDGIAGGALARRADTSQDDEVGDLARSFNKMTDKLNTAIVSRDQEIIDRRNAEEQLLEGIEAKNNFVTMISREFKTPLVAIKEGVEKVLLVNGERLDDKEKQMLELAKKSGENLHKLIGDIVKFHDLETAQEQMHMEENDINEVVQSVHRSMLPLVAEKRGVSFMVDTDKALPRLIFDRQKIELVLTNIVNVAITNTEEGSVLVKTEKEGDNAVKVSVEDTGKGIDKTELAKLFDKFDHPGKKREKKAGGTGLGLAISQEIIKHHHGKVWAESDGDKGVIVSFILPISERRSRT